MTTCWRTAISASLSDKQCVTLRSYWQHLWTLEDANTVASRRLTHTFNWSNPSVIQPWLHPTQDDTTACTSHTSVQIPLIVPQEFVQGDCRNNGSRGGSMRRQTLETKCSLDIFAQVPALQVDLLRRRCRETTKTCLACVLQLPCVLQNVITIF